MIFGRCKLHTTRSGVVQIFDKFYRNKKTKHARRRHIRSCIVL